MMRGAVEAREEVTLYLDTTENHLARWVRDHHSRNLPAPYAAGDGTRICVERARPPYRDGLASRVDIGASAASRAGSVPMGIAISLRYVQY
jgi:hypothetical protein